MSEDRIPEVARNPRSDAEGAHEDLHAGLVPEVDNSELDAKVLAHLGGDQAKFNALNEDEYQDIAELVKNHAEPNPHAAAPASAAPAPIVKATPAEGTGIKDTSKVDSVGNPKGDPKEDNPEPLHGSGPRGDNAPLETLDQEEKRLKERLAEIRSQRGMSNTDQVDSIGNAQHVFEHEIQGHDASGNRIPDRNTGVVLEEAPAHVGPRGVGAPPETFHGKRK